MEGPTSESNQAVYASRKQDSETSEAGVSLESLTLTSETDDTTKSVNENGKGEQEPERHDDTDGNHLDGVGDGVVQPQPASVFNLLPENWDGILPYLSATDFLALVNSSFHWRDMFKSKIAGELLPLVLPILINYLGYGATPAAAVASLLRWRGVNRQSKMLINQLLEEGLSAQNYYEDVATQLYEWSPNVMDAGYAMRSIVDEIRFRHMASNRHRQEEFVAGSASSCSFLQILDLTVDFLNTEIPLQLLSQHGHHLTDLTLELPGFRLEFLFVLVSHTPNLKALKLRGRSMMSSDNHNMPVVQQLNHLTLLEIQNLRLIVPLGPVPSILRICGPKLERLICYIEFLRGGEQNHNVRLLTSGSFPNLTCLRVAVAALTGNDWDIFRQLRTIRLEQLQLFCHPLSPLENYGREFCAVRSLLGVNMFHNTLTHLQLFIRVGKWNQNIRLGESNPAGLLRNVRKPEKTEHLAPQCESKLVLAPCLHQMSESGGTAVARGEMERARD